MPDPTLALATLATAAALYRYLRRRRRTLSRGAALARAQRRDRVDHARRETARAIRRG